MGRKAHQKHDSVPPNAQSIEAMATWKARQRCRNGATRAKMRWRARWRRLLLAVCALEPVCCKQTWDLAVGARCGEVGGASRDAVQGANRGADVALLERQMNWRASRRRALLAAFAVGAAGKATVDLALCDSTSPATMQMWQETVQKPCGRSQRARVCCALGDGGGAVVAMGKHHSSPSLLSWHSRSSHVRWCCTASPTAQSRKRPTADEPHDYRASSLLQQIAGELVTLPVLISPPSGARR